MLPEGDRGNWQYESYCWSGTGLAPGMKKPRLPTGKRGYLFGASGLGRLEIASGLAAWSLAGQGVNGRFSREVAIPRNSLPVRSPTASAKGARGGS